MDATLEATVDDAVALVLTVTNDGADPVELTFRNAGKADFAVLADDREVWRWSDGRMFAQVIGHERLAPGGSANFEGVWADPRPGEYTAVGELRVVDRDVSARTEFTV